MTKKTTDTVFGQWFPDEGDVAKNPMKLAQAAMRPVLPKRFYKSASVGEEAGQFHLLLDGKKARTPARNLLQLPTPDAAKLVAAEWEAQLDVIDPSEMHATRIVNAAIDHVGSVAAEVITEIAKYASSDLLCYRASEPDRLVELQDKTWNPLLEWARETLQIRFTLVEGVMFVAQSDETLRRAHDIVVDFNQPLKLSALHVLTTISGSLVLAMAVAHGKLDAASAYDASELEADFTTEVWGADEEALYRRKRRKAEFLAAAGLFHSLG